MCSCTNNISHLIIAKRNKGVYNENKLKKDKFIRETATELVQLNKFRFFYIKSDCIKFSRGVYKYEWGRN